MTKEVPVSERWMPILGFEGLYEVSDMGYIKRNNRILKNGLTQGYCSLVLSKDGISKTVRVHRIVATAFIRNPENKPMVNHIDGNKQNNKVSNLEWSTHLENTYHARHVINAYPLGTMHHASVLTEEKVMEIRKDFFENPKIMKKTFAKKHGIHPASVNRILSGEIWPGVPVLNPEPRRVVRNINRAKRIPKQFGDKETVYNGVVFMQTDENTWVKKTNKNGEVYNGKVFYYKLCECGEFTSKYGGNKKHKCKEQYLSNLLK